MQNPIFHKNGGDNSKTDLQLEPPNRATHAHGATSADAVSFTAASVATPNVLTATAAADALKTDDEKRLSKATWTFVSVEPKVSSDNAAKTMASMEAAAARNSSENVTLVKHVDLTLPEVTLSQGISVIR